MKKFLKVICALAFAHSLVYAAIETPDQASTRLANAVRLNVIPAIQSSTWAGIRVTAENLQDEVIEWFAANVYSDLVWSALPTTDDAAFLRAAFDSIGINCNATAAANLLTLQPADLATIKAYIGNPQPTEFNLYQAMLRARNILNG